MQLRIHRLGRLKKSLSYCSLLNNLRLVIKQKWRLVMSLSLKQLASLQRRKIVTVSFLATISVLVLFMLYTSLQDPSQTRRSWSPGYAHFSAEASDEDQSVVLPGRFLKMPSPKRLQKTGSRERKLSSSSSENRERESDDFEKSSAPSSRGKELKSGRGKTQKLGLPGRGKASLSNREPPLPSTRKLSPPSFFALTSPRSVRARASSTLVGNLAGQQRLPQCLIIGFTKCGTTALRGFLSLHPAIVTALREVRYFTSNYKKGTDWYRKQMPRSTESQITIEKSAGYITSSYSLQRIRRLNSKMKLIVMVRDPIVRLQSEYARQAAERKASKRIPFKEWCGGRADSSTVMRLTNYVTPLHAVFSLFPKQQVLVLSEEELEDNPLDVLEEVEEFLDLESGFSKNELIYNEEKGFYCFNTSSPKFNKVLSSIVLNEKTGCLGSRKGRPHPEIDGEFFENLVRVIKPFNQRLFRLLNKRFYWDNFEDVTPEL